MGDDNDPGLFQHGSCKRMVGNADGELVVVVDDAAGDAKLSQNRGNLGRLLLHQEPDRARGQPLHHAPVQVVGDVERFKNRGG